MLSSLSKRLLLPWLPTSPTTLHHPLLLQHTRSLCIASTHSSQPVRIHTAALLRHAAIQLTKHAHVPSASPLEPPCCHATRWPPTHHATHAMATTVRTLTGRCDALASNTLSPARLPVLCSLQNKTAHFPACVLGFPAVQAHEPQPSRTRGYRSHARRPTSKKPLPTWLHILRRKRK